MDRQLLSDLYCRYRKELFLYIYSLCGRRELAEDILQETFLKAILSLPDSHTNMKAWLYMVGRNLCFNYLKKEKRQLSTEGWERFSEEGEDLIEGMIVQEERRSLYLALAHLDRRKREVLELQYFGKLPQKEIAKIMGLSPENVRVLSYRAKKEMKQYLEVE